jgi:hypothetical protein
MKPIEYFACQYIITSLPYYILSGWVERREKGEGGSSASDPEDIVQRPRNIFKLKKKKFCTQ